MAAATRLRTEIVVNISLLMGAALLFAGFLLLKLTERELVLQQTDSVAAAMEVVTRAVVSLPASQNSARMTQEIEGLMRGFPASLSLSGWRLLDRQLSELAGNGSRPDTTTLRSELYRKMYGGEPDVAVDYSTFWFLMDPENEGGVIVSLPLFRKGELFGLLQANFSLNDVRGRVLKAYRLMLAFVLLYGSVLVASGMSLLNKTVMKPIRRLHEGTRLVARGQLDQTLPEEGPREIVELAASFNAMIGALEASREETLDHIRSLQRTNEDLQRTQDELIRSEKMASIGHLAAGMAHEIGNPLGAVVGYLEMLRGELDGRGEQELVSRSLDEIGRIDRLVRDLLDYARPAEGEPETLEPLSVLHEAREILTHQGAFARVRMEEDLPVALPEVTIARHKLLQVLVNLLLNARDASPENGRIRLAAGTENGEVWLSVADEGSGISAETLNQIFDPFYTTKAPDKGRGLGLSVCLRIVEEAGGRIEVRTQEGEGSVFTVRLKTTESIRK